MKSNVNERINEQMNELENECENVRAESFEKEKNTNSDAPS